MADPSQSSETRSDHCRDRYFHPSNRSHRGRGRGRARDYRIDNVERALSELGVRDLREHLDRKHQLEQLGVGPPSDPSYNYLRDPQREHEANTTKAHVSTLLRSNSQRGRGRLKYEESTYIQNPMNIKVELSTSTGHRSYSLKEGSKLADIKHVPDYEQSHRGGFVRGRGSRGRGRGRFLNDQPSEEYRIRSKSTERRRNIEGGSYNRSRSVEHKGRSKNTNVSEPNSKFVSESVNNGGKSSISASDFENVPDYQKGRSLGGDNRGRGRGRGRRWGNRRGKGNQRQTKSDTETQPANPCVSTEENWDEEKHDIGEPYYYNPETEYEDAENNDDQTDIPENFSKDISVFVNASEEGNKKRSVRFNLTEDKENKDESVTQIDDNNQHYEVDDIIQKTSELKM